MNLIVDNETSLVRVCTSSDITELDGVFAVAGTKIGVATATATVRPADTIPDRFYPDVFSFIDGAWSVVDQARYEDCLAQERYAHNKRAEALRAEAYRVEADPLFFKAQRGEATTEQWLAKIEEIKARYPDL